MGNAPSKAARQLPKLAKTPPWTGARTSPTAEHPQARVRDKGASGVRRDAIEKDAQDAHLLANLNRLGPVRVDHHIQAVRLTSDTNNLLKSRERTEQEAFRLQLPRNHIHSTALSNLLDERKSATSQNELQRLAEQYGIDIWKLENLARFVSSPSVQRGRAIKTITKEGEENIMMMAVWIEPNISMSHHNGSRSTASV